MVKSKEKILKILDKILIHYGKFPGNDLKKILIKFEKVL